MTSKNQTSYIDVELFFSLLQYLKSSIESTEDIPIPGPRELAKVEGIFFQMQQSIAGRELYQTLEEKCTYLFYAFCKNHPLQNGNKRCAVVLSMTFLFINVPGFVHKIQDAISSSKDELYDLAISVVESDPNEYEIELMRLTNYFSNLIANKK
jgi:prophage maintenance system killer protein